MKNLKTARACGLIMDYIIWYLLMYLMILFYFFVVVKETPFAGNLTGYVEIFNDIMYHPSFLFIYLAALIIYEIVVPLLFGGQTLSKKIFKTEIRPFKVNKILIRGFVKLVIINPCGIISFIIGLVLSGTSVSIISDFMWVVFAVDIVLVLMNKSALHDRLGKSEVEFSE